MITIPIGIMYVITLKPVHKMEGDLFIATSMPQVFSAQAHHRVGALLQVLVAAAAIHHGRRFRICGCNSAFVSQSVRPGRFQREALLERSKTSRLNVTLVKPGWYFETCQHII